MEHGTVDDVEHLVNAGLLRRACEPLMSGHA
jgi:hypothetical protein